MKSTPRPPHQQDLTFGNAYVLRPGEAPRHGPRKHFQKLEYAIAAIADRYPNALPENVNISALTRWLNKRGGHYHFTWQTVDRALKALRTANSPLVPGANH